MKNSGFATSNHNTMAEPNADGGAVARTNATPPSSQPETSGLTAPEAKRPPHIPTIPHVNGLRGAQLETEAFVALAPRGSKIRRNPKSIVQPGTASIRASDAREIVGALFNEKDPKAGWKEAERLGWRVRRCVIRAYI